METKAMDNMSKGASASQRSHNLFQVYLRLRPPQAGAAITERFLAVEPPPDDAGSTAPTHITLNPPNDRRRAVEKFAFTQVLTEDATQLDVFHCTNVVPLVEGVLAPHGGDGTDALLATLGVSGSGKVCYGRVAPSWACRMPCCLMQSMAQLTVSSLPVAYDPRFSVTTRNDPVISGCHLPVHWEEHRRRGHQARA